MKLRWRSYYNAAVDAFIDQYRRFEVIENTVGAPSFDEWYVAKEKFLARRFVCAEQMKQWQNQYKGSRYRDNQDVHDHRMAEVKARVAVMQPQISLSVLRRCPSYRMQESYSGYFSDAAWKILKPKLITEAQNQRIKDIKLRADRMMPPLRDILDECPTFVVESKRTGAMDNVIWATLEPTLRREAETIKATVQTAIKTRIQTIQATIPHVIAKVSRVTLYKGSNTMREQHALYNNDWQLPSPLSPEQTLALATQVEQEINDHLSMVSESRYRELYSAIVNHIPNIDDRVVHQCTAFTQELGRTAEFQRGEMARILTNVSAQAAVIYNQMGLRYPPHGRSNYIPWGWR